MTGASEVPRLFTVRQFAEKHRAFSYGGLRWLLFHRNHNGLSRAVVRVGRRLLIDEQAFFDWVRQQGANGQRSATP